MNLKLRRLVRTPSSEQYALFDPDRTDDNYDPISIGKLDVHYADEGVYGTFLLWQQAVADLPPDQLHALVEATLQELCEPIGLPVFYAVEFFSPDLAIYKLNSNVEEEEDADQDQVQEDGNQDDTE
ncbi:MAG: hypothetical protein P8189_19050 [Anaerolineae bacterium]